MRSLAIFATVLVGGSALAQIATNASPSAEAAAKVWDFSASAYTYLVPDGRDYVQPTITADHGWLHLEARYNYEALETGSTWIGYNFNFGEKLTFELTPMVGGVFGKICGISPGCTYALSFWKLELYSENEYVINPGNASENFFYTWSELSVSPTAWFRVGLAAQRTKLYQTGFDSQRGFLVGFTYKQLSFTTYVFNPDASRPTFVLGVSLGF